MAESSKPTITEFLLARIAEDEAAATCAAAHAAVNDHDWAEWWYGHVKHYERYDPARVLAECKAKQAIVALHHEESGMCRYCRARIEFTMLREDERTFPEYWPCPTLRALAAVYADHPDYDPRWNL